MPLYEGCPLSCTCICTTGVLYVEISGSIALIHSTFHFLHCTVDDEPINVPGVQSNGYPSPPAATKPSPLPALNARPRMATPPSTPKLQPGIGPSRLQQQAAALPEMDGPEGDYEVPMTVGEHQVEAVYHTLTPPDGEEDGPSAHYEEMDIDEEELSKNPPPVWESNVGLTPPPPPSRPRPQTWKRSLERNENYSLLSAEENNPNFQGRPLPVPRENSSQVRKQKTPDQRSSPRLERRKPPTVENSPPTRRSPAAFERSPPVRRSPAAFERSTSVGQIQNQGEVVRDTRRPASYESAGSRRPLPPPKPKPFFSPGTANPSRHGVGFGFDLKNDPRFAQKLEERKQELYGVADLPHPDEDFVQPRGDYPQDSYEEIAFTTTVEVSEPHPPVLPPQRNIPEKMTLPPRRHNTASQLVDSVAGDSSTYSESVDQPQGYRVVDEHSRNEDTNPAMFMARPPIQPKSPSLRREIEQELTSERPHPPARAIRHTSPQLHPKFIHAESVPSRPKSISPEIPRRVIVERSISDPDLASPLPVRAPVSHPVPRVRRGSTPTSPPPLPSRELIRPVAQGDMHPPPPYQKKDRERSPLPAIPTEEPADSPPPVPRRQRVSGAGTSPYAPQRTPSPETTERSPPRGPSPTDDRHTSIVLTPSSMQDPEMAPPIPRRNQSAGRQGHSPPPSHVRPLSTGARSDEPIAPGRSRASFPSMPEPKMTSNAPRIPPKPAERLQADLITVNHNGDSRPRPKVHSRVTRANSSDRPKPPVAKKPAALRPKYPKDNPPAENFDRIWQTTGGSPPVVAKPRPPVPPPKRW